MKPILRVGIPVVLTALTVAGLWLVFAGRGTDDTEAVNEKGSENSRRLPIEDTDMASVGALAGLSLPESTEDFMSARLDDDSQLDVSFTIAPDDETAFLDASGFPEPTADQRVITHTSPLWNVNVDTTIRGVMDDNGDVTRALELTEEDGRTRVRLVVTPAG